MPRQTPETPGTAPMPPMPPMMDAQHLERTWFVPRGLIGWFAVADHRTIGRRYLVTAFGFFVFAGVLAALMRLQLAVPDNRFIGPDLYNQIFTVHGTTMMFLFAVPVMEAMGVYLVPLMVGARNIAFPRLNTYSYFVYLFGGVMLVVVMLLNSAPDVGWFAYVPLAGPDYSPGKRADFWAQLITFTEVAALAVAVELVATILKMRAPGMTLNRIPLFVWAMLVTSFMVIFAMPAVVTGSSFLLMDRLVGTHFFNPAEGGDALLFQHLFWFFGHPEVYIIFVPALGMVSSIIVAFTNRPIFGYTALVLSLIATGFLGFGLWVHHMFTTGLPQLGLTYFTSASMVIAIPSGIQIFCWIASLWRGRPRFHTPLLFVIGFIAIFVLGGLSGVTLASVPFDLQVHDTYYVVAHFHYVLLGGAVFPLIGGLYFWFPKITGRMMDDRLGKVNFWVLFFGFNITFFPMHFLGVMGMPRRVYTYPANMGWGTLNLVSTAGAVLMVVGGALLVFNVVRALRAGERASDNPWNADTLEWGTSSPPPVYNFLYPPVVEGRYALWDRTAGAPVVTGLRLDCREVLITDVMDAHPSNKYELPEPSIWPFLAAVATSLMFLGSIFTPWAVPIGTVPIAITLIGWFWPKKREAHTTDEAAQPAKPSAVTPREARRMRLQQAPVGHRAIDVSDLPDQGAFGHQGLIWWGTAGFMVIEGSMFVMVLITYFYLRLRVDEWPPSLPNPDLFYGTLNLLVLLVSAIPNHLAKLAAEKLDLGATRRWMVLCVLFGVALLVIRGFEYTALNCRWDDNAYGSMVWCLMVLHTIHLATDVGDTTVLTVLTFTGPMSVRRFIDVSENGLYWYFIVLWWIPIYLTVYFAPRWL